MDTFPPVWDQKGRDLQVRFVSEDASLPTLPELPITIPDHLKPSALSEVVNHILELEEMREFDFLVQIPSTGEKHFLRSSLRSFMKAHSLSYETVVDIECLEVSKPPEPSYDIPHEDWVSALQFLSSNHIVTGAYDGSIRIVELPWIRKEKDADDADDAGPVDHEYANVVQRSAHDLFVKCIAPLDIECARAEDGVNEIVRRFRCVSGSKDKTLKIWSWDAKNNFTCDSVLIGHTLGVECLAASPSRDRCVSGGWDGSLKLWDLSTDADHFEEDIQSAVNAHPDKYVDDDDDQDFAEGDEMDLGDHSRPKKKRRTTDSQSKSRKGPRQMPAYHTISEHSHMCITNALWREESVVVTASMDHKARWIDPTKSSVSREILTNAAISALDYDTRRDLLLTGHVEGFVHVWDRDARSQKSSLLLGKKSGERISYASFSQKNDYHIWTTDYSGHLSVWDMRASPLDPVHCVGRGDEKIFCADRHAMSGRIVTGGTSKKAVLYESSEVHF
eukprot:TRINITY_DN3296_c0_g1_i1.p1 TRINITY_DN3296_c0_g1~~TRINITY_DN3296_c0_g1_i1.p1  ORF type:complete len:504 (+),score=142.42 TRINITY_DN3296_c0_g1_i1:140-1651(+)